MVIRSNRIIAGLAIGLASAGLVLAGCGQVAEQAAEQAVEQAMGEDADINVEDGSVSMTDAEGNNVAIGENVALPDNWPAEIPVYDGGTLSLASVDAASGVTAMWMTDATPEDAAAAYGAALEAAGYSVDSETSMEGMAGGDYRGNGWLVSVVALGAEDGNSLMVTASKQ